MGTEHLRTVAQGRIKKLAIKRVRSYVVEGIRDKLFSDVSYSVHNISRKNGTKATNSPGMQGVLERKLICSGMDQSGANRHNNKN